MTQDNNADVLQYDNNNAPTLSSGLNVLTILTFIGCAIQLLGSLWTFFNAKKSYDGIDKLTEQMNSGNMPGWAKRMMGDPETMIAMIKKTYENRIPIVLLSLVAIALCFYGALQMRKLKKQGFLLYTIGEVLPFLTQFLFIGAFAFTGVSMYVGIGLALLFILLYSMQRKNLVY
ncbi:MAG: hypothetical protein R2765_03345 [Ferruginibacter sp.]|nr:hypothetical protein [Ferruginibacter sp.]MCB0708902.1 hypothetical protein [Chitinophagaceae bacterium]